MVRETLPVSDTRKPTLGDLRAEIDRIRRGDA